MATSYTITEKIKNLLATSDKLRAKILLTPVSTRVEREIKWFFKVERIKWAMAFTETPLSDFEIIKILGSPYPKKPTMVEKQVFALKNVFEYIQETWTASPKPVELVTIKRIYEIGCKPYMGRMLGLTDMSLKMVYDTFNFLNQGKEHPIILAGIAQVEFVNARLLEYGNPVVARLLSYLMLYKNGYDIRGMYNLDEYHKKDLQVYNTLLDTVSNLPNITAWLEYYAQGVVENLENSLQKINDESLITKRTKTILKLNHRQKELLSTLEKPGTKVTNKDFQKLFGVSQITASRDLSRLTNLGFLLTQGKGRSVFYTKV